MTVIVIALAVVLAVALLALHLRRRGRATDPALLATASDIFPEEVSDAPAGPGPADVVLVPFPNETGQALVIGSDDALAAFDHSGLARRGASARSGPVPQLVRDAMAVGGLAATDAFQRGVRTGRIVALAPETMAQLKKGKPVYDKAGNVLALVRGDRSRIKHVMRLDRAGAQAAAASNMATLAVTAALSQQLEAISVQLQEMSRTLEGMVRDQDRERLADAVAANEILFELEESVRRRGITEADYAQLASLKHRVTSLQIETTAKLDEIASGDVDRLNRSRRREILERLYENERLEYWLAVRVQADLARTRSDMLTLLWEHRTHPATAGALNQRVAAAIRARQARAAAVGDALRALSDPAANTRLDPVRLISRRQLDKQHRRVHELLQLHGVAYLGPEDDPHTVPPALLETGRDA